MNYWKQSRDNVYVAAHRGWSELYPENTMPAFRAALTLPIDQIETDVRITKDGELVLMHDPTVDRTTDGTGLLCEKTYEEVLLLDAGIKKGEQFRGTKVPKFTEFMELVRDHETLTLNVELKEYPSGGREALSYSVCDRVCAIIDEYGYTDRVVINTFSGKLAEYLNGKYGKKYRQHVYYPVTHMGKVTRDPYSYGYSCCMYQSFCEEINMASVAEFDRMNAMGCEAWAPTSVFDERGVDLALERGASLITCNDPDAVLEYLRKKGKHI